MCPRLMKASTAESLRSSRRAVRTSVAARRTTFPANLPASPGARTSTCSTILRSAATFWRVARAEPAEREMSKEQA